MDVKTLLAQSEKLFTDVQAIIGNPQATAEERAKIQPMLDDAKKYKADALILMDIVKEAATLGELAKGASGGSRQNNGDAPAGFKSWGEFLKAVHLAKHGSNRPDPRLKYFTEEAAADVTREEKDMSGESGATGGYLIDEEFRAQLLSVPAETGIVRARATIIPMRSRQIAIPALDQTQSLAAGVPRLFGGLTFHWIGEGELKPASDPRFREVNLVAKKLVGFTRASDELLADAAISLEAFLSSPLGLAGGITWMEEYAFFHGTGVAQPLGIFNSPALLTVRREVSGAVKYADLVAMLVAAMPSAKLTWVISQSVLGDLMNMTDADGRLIWATATEGGSRTLLGLPYRVSEKLPAKGTTGDVLLADFSYYLIGDRQRTTVESTKFEAWQYDKTSWRAVHRVDGQPWLNAPITYQDTTTQISPFVALSSDVS